MSLVHKVINICIVTETDWSSFNDFTWTTQDTTDLIMNLDVYSRISIIALLLCSSNILRDCIVFHYCQYSIPKVTGVVKILKVDHRIIFMYMYINNM